MVEEELVSQDFVLSPENFQRYFVDQKDITFLRQQAQQTGLNSLRCRFLAWQIFLGILPEEGGCQEWVNAIRQYRQQYRQITESLCVNFTQKFEQTDLDPTIFNPLSTVIENPWNNLHEDNELKHIIRADIERTFQEKALFQQPYIHEIMLNVLFTWSKENSNISYKQGMNELLGILLFVAYAERATQDYDITNNSELRQLNDPNHIEADLYWVFSRIMSMGIKELFNPVVQKRAQKTKKDDLFSWDKEEENDLVHQDKSDSDDASSVLKRCHKIHHRYLQAIDSELYNHLERQKIEPQIYLQQIVIRRWLRCMLSREFNLADTLVIWDAVFSCVSKTTQNSNQQLTGRLDFNRELVLVDFICVSMLVFVRAFCNFYIGLQSDSSGILRRLLKFPPVEDISSLVNMAIGHKNYILGGCKSAKPSFTPQRSSQNVFQSSPSRPVPLFNQEKKVQENPLGTPRSQPQQKPVQIQPTNIQKIDQVIQIMQGQSQETFNAQQLRQGIEILRQVRESLSSNSKPQIPMNPLQQINTRVLIKMQLNLSDKFTQVAASDSLIAVAGQPGLVLIKENREIEQLSGQKIQGISWNSQGQLACYFGSTIQV